jgi:hypothetical protein
MKQFFGVHEGFFLSKNKSPHDQFALVMWAFVAQAETTLRELSDPFSSYTARGEKKANSRLDTIDGIYLQSFPLDLLATGKFHASYESSPRVVARSSNLPKHGRSFFRFPAV